LTDAPVRVLLTMDCERVKDNPFYPAGPASWKESERNIRSVPEAVEAHRQLFTSLMAEGHEVGLHLHPNTFRLGVNEYLARLPGEVQRTLIRDARDVFASALGIEPRAFRPGHFSANAETFSILASLGFARMSAAVPGRTLPGTGGDWTNWPRQCHYVGSLFEAPVTVHHLSRSRTRMYTAAFAVSLARHGALADAVRASVAAVRGRAKFGTVRGRTLVDFRIEDGTGALLDEIVSAEIERLRGEGGLPALTAVTHSYVNFSEEDQRSDADGVPRRALLTRMLERLRNRGCVPRTLAELQQDFDAHRAARPPVAAAAGRA